MKKLKRKETSSIAITKSIRPRCKYWMILTQTEFSIICNIGSYVDYMWYKLLCLKVQVQVQVQVLSI